MKKLPLLLTALALHAPAAFAVDERLFSVDESGQIYELTAKRSLLGWAKDGLKWEKVDEKEFKKPDFKIEGDTRINNGVVEVNRGGSFVNSGFTPPPPGMTYSEAAVDASGNVYVRLGGSGSGINYWPSGANRPILARGQTWAPGPLPGAIDQIHAIPNTDSVLALVQGKVYRIEPPVFGGKRSFDWELVPNLQDVESLHTVGGKVMATGAKIGVTELDGIENGVYALTAKNLAPPTPSKTFASNLRNSPDAVVNLANSLKVKAAPPPAPVAPAPVQPSAPAPVQASTSAPAASHAPASAPVAAAPAGPAAPAAPRAQQKTIEDLIEEGKLAKRVSGAEADAALEFLGMVEKNLYDKSVNTNNSGKDFVEYFGREKELQELVDAFGKTEKGHVLVTGKAGTGKTTLFNMLQDAIIRGKVKFPHGKLPIMLELPITAVTNPTDPSAIKKVIAGAKLLSKATGQPVKLYVDEAHVTTPMTRQALKGFLTDITSSLDDATNVQFAFSTTSNEAKEFVADTAFSRRWTEVHVSEFNKPDTIQLIKQAHQPRWIKEHQLEGYNFAKVSDDAFDYAYRFAGMEQPHAGNPTGTKELLEAAIVRKRNRGVTAGQQGDFTLEAQDIRDYLKEKRNLKLMPGDPNFDKTFNEMWSDFEKDYVGNDGMKAELKGIIHSHFGQPDKSNLTAVTVFGPPGSGKSYGAEEISKTFFKGAILETNGAELKNGGLELNKLIGSPAGTVDSESRGSLVQMLLDHPDGFVWKIEEGDYMHPDVVQLKTNIITSKKFKDGLGKEWDASKVMIWENSNIGQDLMIPNGMENKMTWPQFEIRKNNITQKALIGGKEVTQVKPEILQGVFQNYIHTIVTKADPGMDTSIVNQEAAKQVRRYTPLYAMLPERKELEDAARSRVAKYIKDMKLEHGVNFVIPDETIMKLIDLDHYNFTMGHGYVNKQIERKLKATLVPYLSERGATVHVGAEDVKLPLDGEEVPSQNLLVKVNDGPETVHNLGAVDTYEKNPWGSNKEMMKRIDNFAERAGEHVKGNTHVVEDIAQALKEKSVDWNAHVNITLLGTSGNGKTQMAKAMAVALYDDPNALFTITGVDHPWDLSDYFRPPTGIVGGNKETDFERWFKSRKNSGGGIILFDELLSEIGKDSGANVEGRKGGKLAVLQELYELLAERKLKIGGQYHDARAFQVVITGNTLQELFNGLDDNPETADLVKKITAELTRSKVVEELERHGLDAPKIARLGRVHVLGPQPPEVSLEVGKMKLDGAIKTIRKEYRAPLEIAIDERAIPAVVSRLSTVKLGMREVETGFNTLVFQPLRTMISDLAKTRGIAVNKIEMKLDGEEPKWFVNGQEVVLQAEDQGAQKARKLTWEFKDQMKPHASIVTPTMDSLNSVEKMKVTPELLRGIAEHEFYGHWMTNALLNRQNGADFVSLIPGPGYLGYVRPKSQEVTDVEGLTSMMKRVIELEAGHRANQYHGTYSPGGGNGGEAREAGKPARDDLGKIQQYYKRMINNGMIPNVSETTPEGEKAAFYAIMDKVIDDATDEVLDLGIKSKQFDPLFDDLMKKRYLKKDEMEKFLQHVDFDKLGYHGQDSLFLEKMSASFVKAIHEASDKVASAGSNERLAQAYERELEKVKTLASGMMGRTFREAEVKAAGNQRALAEIAEIKQALVQAVKDPGKGLHPRMRISCEQRFDSLF